MAHTKRNETHGPAAPKVERDLREPATTTAPDERSTDHSGAALETLNLGHACLRSECWSPSAARHRRGPAPRRSPLHCSRPPERADARLVSNDYEILSA
jgi:hypothetical protein